jgi:hypothetical protein
VTERPLHVQVAEALSFQCWQLEDESWWTEAGNVVVPVPRYDTDWAATGPLLERFRLTLRPGYEGSWAAHDNVGINATAFLKFGPTPLEALCSLILALHKAGKLHP